MCLRLYVGAERPLPEQVEADLRVEPVEPSRAGVRQRFSQPSVQLVGAHASCGCGFPYVVAEQPIAYFDGMWPEGQDRQADIRSMSRLLELVRANLEISTTVQLYPVWDGEECLEAKGVVEWRLSDLVAEKAVFTERFLHVVRREAV